jgi:hypothetical protein
MKCSVLSSGRRGQVVSEGTKGMMAHGMMDGGTMMWGMGFIGLLAFIVLVLLAAALVKYLFFH